MARLPLILILMLLGIFSRVAVGSIPLVPNSPFWSEAHGDLAKVLTVDDEGKSSSGRASQTQAPLRKVATPLAWYGVILRSSLPAVSTLSVPLNSPALAPMASAPCGLPLRPPAA